MAWHSCCLLIFEKYLQYYDEIPNQHTQDQRELRSLLLPHTDSKHCFAQSGSLAATKNT